MAIEKVKVEIKGLGDTVNRAREAIRKARNSVAGMHESGRALEDVANQIAKTFDQHREDLLFEAQTLGNSNGSDESSEQKDEQPFQSPGAGNSADNQANG